MRKAAVSLTLLSFSCAQPDADINPESLVKTVKTSSREIKRREVKTPREFRKRTAPVHLVRSLWGTDLGYLLDNPEELRTAYINLRETELIQTIEGPEGPVDITIYVAYRLNPDTLIRGVFGIEFSGDQELTDMNYRSLSSRIKRLRSQRDRLDQISPEAYDTVMEMLGEYASWEDKPDMRRWNFLHPEEFDPTPSGSTKNYIDIFIERTIGNDLAITPEEREYLSRRITDRSDSVRGYIEIAKKSMDCIPYREFATEEPNPLLDVFSLADPSLHRPKGRVGNCEDHAYTFARIWTYLKEEDPDVLTHIHAIPTSVYRMDPTGNGYRCASHKIITLIDTSSYEISFHDPSGFEVDSIPTMIHR